MRTFFAATIGSIISLAVCLILASYFDADVKVPLIAGIITARLMMVNSNHEPSALKWFATVAGFVDFCVYWMIFLILILICSRIFRIVVSRKRS